VAVLRLDSTNMDFSATSDDGRDLAVETLEGVAVPFRTVFWDKPARRGRIEVRLDPPLLRPGSRFRLRWGLPDSIRTDSVATWDAIPDSQRLELTSVLIDDFEDSDLVSETSSKGIWSSHAGDSATISAPAIASAGVGRKGMALKVAYSMIPIKGYALVTVPLSDGPRSLRSIDSIELWARGDSTTLTIALEYPSGASSRKAWGDRKLDGTWQRITIRPSEFVAATGVGGNVGWVGVRDSVTSLAFFAALGHELWIDDIRIHGIDRDDLE